MKKLKRPPQSYIIILLFNGLAQYKENAIYNYR
jgi:hypothetical protein